MPFAMPLSTSDDAKIYSVGTESNWPPRRSRYVRLLSSLRSRTNCPGVWWTFRRGTNGSPKTCEADLVRCRLDCSTEMDAKHPDKRRLSLNLMVVGPFEE